MAKQRKKAAPKSDKPRRQTALSRTEKGPPELVLQAQSASGVPDAEAAIILVAQAAAIGTRQSGTNEELLQDAMHMLGQIKPEGALQSMLAVQMIGVHNAAVKFLIRAIEDKQTFEGWMRTCCARLASCGCLTDNCSPWQA